MPRRISLALAALVAVLIVSACGAGSTATTSTLTGATSTGPLSYEGVPLQSGPSLASPGTTGTATVDGISCAPIEQLAYHIHAHLAVYDNGRLYSLPAGIGIPGSSAQESSQGPIAVGGRCIYWLHTHAPDGVIHIESPAVRLYRLGEFFDEWHQPLSSDQVASLHGKVTAYYNDQVWHRSPRELPLLPHALIQLDVGSPAPAPTNVSWLETNL